MKENNKIMADEWLQYAKDDLESAGIILKESDNFHIAVYHSHQSIEKALKWFLLKHHKKFPFVHDLKVLLKDANEIVNFENQLDDILFIDNLYPQLRYPTGEKVSQEEAEKSLQIAKRILKLLTSK